MKKRFIQYRLIKITLAALAVAVTLIAPDPAQADTSWVAGGNWADANGNYETGVIYPLGITSTTTTTQAEIVADAVASDDQSIGINFVRIGINPATISDNWSTFQTYVNRLIADGMYVDLCCWTASTSTGTVTDESAWQSMWETVDSVYSGNGAVYYEPINEPFGYANESALATDVYVPFLNFINKSQNHIILDGTGYAADVTGVGADSRFTGCLLGVHDYGFWHPSLLTESAWEANLQAAVGSYASRTIMTEMGATATIDGLNYGTSTTTNAMISSIRGMCIQCRAWPMGFAYWPTHRASDTYKLFRCLGGNVTNPSLVSELEYGWNVGSYTPAAASPCVATTADGRLELFAVCATNDCLYTDYQLTNGTWSGWVTMSTSRTWAQQSVPVVATNSDGRLEVFIMGTDGYMNHIWQLTPGSSASTNWSGFSEMTSGVFEPTARIAVGTWANGCLDVFVIGVGNNLGHAYELPGGGWSNFSSLGGATFTQDTDVAVNNELDGREEVILIGTGGNLCQNYQTAANSTNWSGWNNLGGSMSTTGSTALMRDTDGRLEFFTIGTGGNASRNTEVTANTPGSWTGFVNMGGTWNTSAKVNVAADEDGALEFFIVDTTGVVNHAYQTGNATWSSWSQITGSTLHQTVNPCVGLNANGTLELFAIGTGGNMGHVWETNANSAIWSSWANLGGVFH